jgi:hypothetical protein
MSIFQAESSKGAQHMDIIDLCTVGKASVVTRAKNNMVKQFECDDVGKIEKISGKQD